MEDEVNIMGYVYRKADVIEGLNRAGCKVLLSEACDRYDIQEAMETLTFPQADSFWSFLLPKSIRMAEPLARIGASNPDSFFKDVIDKIQFHNGDGIKIFLPVARVGVRPRKNPFGSIVPRPKPFRLSEKEKDEINSLCATTHRYAAVGAVNHEELMTTVVALHVSFNQINKPSTMQLKEGDIFYQAFRTSTPMSFQVLSVDRDNNKCRVLCTSFEGHSHEETWDDLDLTEMAFGIGEYKMADLSKYPAYDVSKTYKDGDLFEYNGHVTMYYGERLINIPFGLEEYDDMVSYCKSKCLSI